MAETTFIIDADQDDVPITLANLSFPTYSTYIALGISLLIFIVEILISTSKLFQIISRQAKQWQKRYKARKIRRNFYAWICILFGSKLLLFLINWETPFEPGINFQVGNKTARFCNVYMY